MTTGLAWTEVEVSTLVELWGTGASYEAIGEAIGKTASAVQSKAGFMSLPRRRWPQAQHPTARFRPCMCCGTRFHSEWLGNRLCATCKSEH